MLAKGGGGNGGGGGGGDNPPPPTDTLLYPILAMDGGVYHVQTLSIVIVILIKQIEYNGCKFGY